MLRTKRYGMQFNDLTGKKFGRLMVQWPVGKVRGGVSWLCLCDCGTLAIVQGRAMTTRDHRYKAAHTRSCGCLSRQRSSEGNKKHGLSRHPLYHTWNGILRRCLNPKANNFDDYGGRGIVVCERWTGTEGFKNFLADVGPRPTPQHSLDRKDNDKGYSPENCVWATDKEQIDNRRIRRIENFTDEALISECLRRGFFVSKQSVA